ncbi:MAG: hypothetical protein ABUS57_12005 [Pseudomonadota bacterium]
MFTPMHPAPGIDDADAVTPSLIDHKCEEIADGPRYNYLRYEFEIDGRFYWARTYLDEIESVSIFGPFEIREKMEFPTEDIDPRVLAYFQRRYKTILRLTANGYEPIWQAD